MSGVGGTVESLVLDLLEWIGPGPRPYDEVLEAWHRSCPGYRWGRRPEGGRS